MLEFYTKNIFEFHKIICVEVYSIIWNCVMHLLHSFHFGIDVNLELCELFLRSIDIQGFDLSLFILRWLLIHSLYESNYSSLCADLNIFLLPHRVQKIYVISFIKICWVNDIIKLLSCHSDYPLVLRDIEVSKVIWSIPHFFELCF